MYYYFPFSAISDTAKLYNDLRWNITRPQGFEAVMRVRCSQVFFPVFSIHLCSSLEDMCQHNALMTTEVQHSCWICFFCRVFKFTNTLEIILDEFQQMLIYLWFVFSLSLPPFSWKDFYALSAKKAKKQLAWLDNDK